MATVKVLRSGNGWRVTKSGTTISNHRKKAPAKRAAKRAASGGDRLVIQRSNGTIQDQRRVR